MFNKYMVSMPDKETYIKTALNMSAIQEIGFWEYCYEEDRKLEGVILYAEDIESQPYSRYYLSDDFQVHDGSMPTMCLKICVEEVVKSLKEILND